MATFLLYLQFRTQVRGNVSAASRTARSPRCSRKNNNTSASTNHAATRTAATAIIVRTLQTTQDCMHTVRHGFVRYLARRVPSHLVTPSTSVSHSERVLLEFEARGSAGRTHSRAQDPSLCGDPPFSSFGKTPIRLLHVVTPAAVSHAHHQCILTTPSIYPKKLSNCRRSTPTLINVTQDEMKNPSAN